MIGLAVASGVICLEGALSSIKDTVDTSNSAVAECLAVLQDFINVHAHPPPLCVSQPDTSMLYL